MQDYELELFNDHLRRRSDAVDRMLEEDRLWEEKRKSADHTKEGVKKFGLDFHGVVDRFPDSLSLWSARTVEQGHEVHIVTGSRWTKEFKDTLADLGFIKGVNFTHFFSITDYHVANGEDVEFDEEGRPWMDAKLWNRTKGHMAALCGLDVLWDDSPTYGKYFTAGCRYITFAHENFTLEAQEILEGRVCLAGRK